MINHQMLHRRYQIGPAALFSAALIAGALVLFAGGCGSSSSTVQTTSTTNTSDWVAQWEAEAERWKGVPHRWGGTTQRGIDCSALVQTLYRDVTGVRLPRTTRAQVRTGDRVRKRDLQPGDLVFFHLEKSRHVGVYLDNGRFVHASSSQGVSVSNLSDSYWTNRYWTARRITSGQSSTANAGSDSAGAPRSSSSRSGW